MYSLYSIKTIMSMECRHFDSKTNLCVCVCVCVCVCARVCAWQREREAKLKRKRTIKWDLMMFKLSHSVFFKITSPPSCSSSLLFSHNKLQPSNQFTTDKIMSRPTFFSCPRSPFTWIYVTIGKKWLSQLLFHADFKGAHTFLNKKLLVLLIHFAKSIIKSERFWYQVKPSNSLKTKPSEL